jgi:hypothetical protein
MNMGSRFSGSFWRLGHLRNGFLEGDQDWGTVRFVAVFASAFVLVIVGAFIELVFNPGLPNTWLEQSVLALYVPRMLLRYIALIFSWSALRYIILPVLPLSVALIVGGKYLQDIYELGSYGQSVRYLLSCLFAWDYPVLHIQRGKKTLAPGEVNLLDQIGGPGYVFISPGSAVLFESLTHPSAVLSQGKHFISRFETISDIIDLSDQHGMIEKTQAMSKDGIIVRVHDIQYRYRIWGGRRYAGLTGRSPTFPYPFSAQAVRNIAYNRPIRNGTLATWNSMVQSTFDGEIMGYIRTHLLDDVINSGEGVNRTREEIRNAILSSKMRNNMKNIGTELVWFDIGHFSYEEPVVEDQWIKVWAADWVGEAEVERAQGDAERQAAIAMARSEAQAEVLNELVKAFENTRLTQDLNQESMPKIFLFKVSQILDALTMGYQSLPDES